jgi:hypothetical protein
MISKYGKTVCTPETSEGHMIVQRKQSQYHTLHSPRLLKRGYFLLSSLFSRGFTETPYQGEKRQYFDR